MHSGIEFDLWKLMKLTYPYEPVPVRAKTLNASCLDTMTQNKINMNTRVHCPYTSNWIANIYFNDAQHHPFHFIILVVVPMVGGVCRRVFQ